MGLWGSGKLPGKSQYGKRCDYCNRDMSHLDKNKQPTLGGHVLDGHNRYFCSSECLNNYRQQHNL